MFNKVSNIAVHMQYMNFTYSGVYTRPSVYMVECIRNQVYTRLSAGMVECVVHTIECIYNGVYTR